MLSISDLDSKYTYITIGTAQQIRYLFRDIDHQLIQLYHPTTDELIKEVSYQQLIRRSARVIICYPSTFEGTANLSSRTRSAKIDNPSLIPNDRYFFITGNTYLFIMVGDILGNQIPKKSQLNKLIGGYTKLLDLSSVQNYELADHPLYKSHINFPLTLSHKAGYKELLPCDNPDESCNSYEHFLITSLLTKQCAKLWGNFNDSQLFKYFLNPNYHKIPLLSMTRAWSLEPYLMPFVSILEQQGSISNRSAILANFALWVYFSSTYWSNHPYESGLVYRQPSRPNQEPYFSFYITKRAKIEWMKMIDCKYLRARKEKLFRSI